MKVRDKSKGDAKAKAGPTPADRVAKACAAAEVGGGRLLNKTEVVPACAGDAAAPPAYRSRPETVVRDKEMVAAYFKLGERVTLKAAAATLGVNVSRLRNAFYRLGIAYPNAGKKRGPRPVTHFDESVFDDAENKPVVAMWLGVLMADLATSNYPCGSTNLRLKVARRDRQLVELFRKFIGTRRPVRDGIDRRGHGYSYLNFNSPRVQAELASHGVTGHREDDARALRLAGSADFWAGMVFGDGWVYHRTHQREGVYKRGPHKGEPYKETSAVWVGLCGSRTIITQFIAWCESVGVGVGKDKQPCVDGSIFRVEYTAEDAVRLARILFAGRKYGLKRKLKKAREIDAWGKARGI